MGGREAFFLLSCLLDGGHVAEAAHEAAKAADEARDGGVEVGSGGARGVGRGMAGCGRRVFLEVARAGGSVVVVGSHVTYSQAQERSLGLFQGDLSS